MSVAVRVSEPQGSPPPDERRKKLELVPIAEDRPKQEVLIVQDDIPTLDTAKFQHMYRVAQAMAQGTLVPDTLKGNDISQTVANCFRVVNQAVRWKMDPFALLDCASIIKGKLCWEGKVIAAVLEETLGVRLKYQWGGEGDGMRIEVSGILPDGDTETLIGSVAEWKTTGVGTPWIPKQYRKMLAYRGAREWARLYAPGVMLGIYTPDEMTEAREERTLPPKLTPPPARRAPELKAPARPIPIRGKGKEEETGPSEADQLAAFAKTIGACKKVDQINAVYASSLEMIMGLSAEEREKAEAFVEDARRTVIAPRHPDRHR